MSAAPRRRLACRLCTRRKVKCDKQIPCHNCVKRGTPAECERDDADDTHAQSSISSARHQSNDDTSAVGALRVRVAELEAALQEKIAETNGAAQSSTTTPATDQAEGRTGTTRLRSSSPSQGSEIADAVTVLEFLAWGRMKDPDNAMLSPEALRVSEHDDGGIGISSPAEELDCYALDSGVNLVSWLQILLPSRRQVYQLVDYHSNCMLWFHGSYLAPTLSKELASFYADHGGKFDSKKGVALQWVALLFSIMAGTITSAPAHEARKWGFAESEARLLSQKWYKAVVVALNAANFTAHHSLHAVQAITTLTNTAHMLGHSNAQSVMLASAVRIAQSLGLHRLDDEAPGHGVELETGRRVWQELCTQDWFSTAFSESYSINPLHSTSLPPQNCDDDLNVLDESEPTVTSFCRFLSKIAAIMPALQDAMAMSNTLYTKHEAVLVYDKKMRSLATGRPSFLANTAFDTNWPCYIPWARRAIAMSSAHKIIMIHRKLLGLSFTNPVFAFTRRTCLAASKTILKEYLASSRDESSPMLWTHQAFAVAACIVICFDILHSPYSGQGQDESSQLVDQTLEHLQLCQQKSMIAARGVKVLNALQKQIENRRVESSSGGSSSRKRGSNDAPVRDSSNSSSSTPRKRRRGFDAAEFARSFCEDQQDRPPLMNQGIPERLNSNEELDLIQQRAEDTTQEVGVDEPLTLPNDLNWLWSMPLSDEDGTQTFDNLLSFANQGRGF
ncbi:uncharacterized protein Z520_08852 [Fonsecaea multimorphosa CBS 102226]|uniref:Zn(2)-C6 fungal-type domain-containing protein n=1 Tax=Fonsecaea multimorphosa CBS 102226 TaxID=1442371 RepID=A0A0D2H0K0_9EURO|nr:uncharacterized protein Z520_08852 [Fonsecaea multimorphosa CBS 102226]KIX95335.1 hypothetical protein Z520_08852 [Fonsecaea multimorphosa CBS 102226]OAL21131.1 hypothetical protein AYO22_08288 [Fonsecaea multimorphosa]